MSAHPSLSTDFVGAPPLRPVTSMAPYALCWCGSEKKYKWCHHRREEQPKVDVFAIEAQLRSLAKKGYCSHPAASSSVCTKISQAHTVQRRGGLAAIARDGHVLTVKPSMKAMIEAEGAPGPRLVGVGRASVFPGFCSAHDTELFKPVEGKDVDLTATTAFLLGFRAIAYERYSKSLELESVPFHRQVDCGRSYFHQCLIQQHLHAYAWGVRRGLRDAERWKADYDAALTSGHTAGLSFVMIRFNRTLPVVGCGAFHVEFDLNGEPLQRLTRGDLAFDYVAWNLTVFEGRTVAVFSSICPPGGPAARFMKSVKAMAEDRMADAMIRIAFEQSDNLFLKPDWWEGLSDGDRSALQGRTARFASGRPRSSRMKSAQRRSPRVSARLLAIFCERGSKPAAATNRQWRFSSPK